MRGMTVSKLRSARQTSTRPVSTAASAARATDAVTVSDLATVAGAGRGGTPGRALPRRARHLPRGLGRAIGPLLLLLVWQGAYAVGLINQHTLAPPSAVIGAARQLIVTGQLFPNLWISLARAMIGLALGVMIGTVVAVSVGLSSIAENIFDGPMQMMRTTPVTALVPLFVIWFGIGESAKIAMVAAATIFPVYVNLVGGIRGVDMRLVEAARAYGLDGLALIRHVIVPAAMPSFLVGLRYSTGLAWVVLVISEQINANSGIGYLMVNAEQYFQTDVILVGLLIYSALGLLSDYAVRLAERRTLAWRPALGDHR